jgi:hypothetical protein
MGDLMEQVSTTFTYEQIYLHLLFKAYPYLKKRANENPEPGIVDIVDKIETLMHIENGDFS